MSETARVLYNAETGLFCIETDSGESRAGLSKAEASTIAAAINDGRLKAAQLNEVEARAYVQSGLSRQWDGNSPASTPAQKG